MNATHPAAAWALGEPFDDSRVDCTTAVVLKILDGKCKMSDGEKAAITAIYRAVRRDTPLFGRDVHLRIDGALVDQPDTVIHTLRVRAEAAIPKPVMKAFKAYLRDGLF
ncbi:MAG: hypothetical protein ACPGUC_09655, partial [Gammaproteobacteria bacterium]